MAKAPDQRYGLIVIDAFSSDAIPVHLLTREALAVYLSKLTDDGMLLFHISNRYVDLKPVLGDLAGDAGLSCQAQDDIAVSPALEKEGKTASQCVVMTRRASSRLSPVVWGAVRPRPGVRVWTDDYCDLVGALRFKALE